MVFRQLRELVGVDPDAPAVEVDGLTETFRLYHEKPSGIKERLVNPARTSSYTDFDALEDISFTVDHGESVGIIGPNGAGKSTLLKVLAKILPPDAGRADANGRVAALLELGAGFHGDLSGRENIYLNGAILGLTRAEINEQFDDIVDFAGIRPFLDTAVRNYSSGMYVRLGFAIAVHADADILLVDEILSVGDAEFQEKSLKRMMEFREEGRTVLFVSHDLAAVHELADRVIVLSGGQIVFDGNAREGIKHYTQAMGSLQGSSRPREQAALGTGRVAVEQVELLDDEDRPAAQITPGARLRLRVDLRAHEDIESCSVGVNVASGNSVSLYEVHTAWQGLGVGPLERGEEAAVEVVLTANVLAGHYTITVVVTDAAGREEWAVWPEAVSFEVRPTTGGAGMVDFAATTAVAEGPALRLEPRDSGPVLVDGLGDGVPDAGDPPVSATG